jgi:TolB-like protein
VSLNPGLPEELERITNRALEKDRESRYSSTREMLADLKAVRLESEAAKPSLKGSIVVLPFEDISPGRDNEYFSDGLTEEIIADLSQVRELRVISRS